MGRFFPPRHFPQAGRKRRGRALKTNEPLSSFYWGSRISRGHGRDWSLFISPYETRHPRRPRISFPLLKQKGKLGVFPSYTGGCGGRGVKLQVEVARGASGSGSAASLLAPLRALPSARPRRVRLPRGAAPAVTFRERISAVEQREKRSPHSRAPCSRRGRPGWAGEGRPGSWTRR